MKRTTGRTGAVVSLLFLLSAGTASAQWHATGIAVAEYDTKQTLLLLGGVSASPGGKDIAPVLGVQAYHLGYDNGSNSRTNNFVIKPYVGLKKGYDGGEVGANVGYSFSNKDVSGFVSSVVPDEGDGVVVGANWDYWGRGNDPMGYQLLGSYNFGSEGFWGRGRVTRRISAAGASQRRFGGEVAYLSGTGYSAVQPGAVLEFHDPKGNILGLGAGMKFFGNGQGNAVYFKVEGVIPLMR